MTRTIDAAMVASTLGLATVALGAAGQRSRMKAGLSEGRCSPTLCIRQMQMPVNPLETMRDQRPGRGRARGDNVPGDVAASLAV
jgi:hypothetical protein